MSNHNQMQPGTKYVHNFGDVLTSSKTSEPQMRPDFSNYAEILQIFCFSIRVMSLLY